jgi:hypothetical protein
MESSVVSDKRRPAQLILLYYNYVKTLSLFVSALRTLTFNNYVLFNNNVNSFKTNLDLRSEP